MRYFILLTLFLGGCGLEVTQPPTGAKVGDWICNKEDPSERYIYHHPQYGGVAVVYHGHVFSVDPLFFEKCQINKQEGDKNDG